MIQHSSGLLKTLELVIKWVVLLMPLITLASTVLAARRSSKHYYAKYRRQKKESSEESLTKHLISYQVVRGCSMVLNFDHWF